MRRFVVETDDNEEIQLNKYFIQEELDSPKVILRFMSAGESNHYSTQYKFITNDPNFDVIDMYFKSGENNEFEIVMKNSFFMISNKFNIPTRRFMIKSLEHMMETVSYKLTNVRKINHMMIKETSEMILNFEYPILMFRKCAWKLFGFYLTHKVKGLKDFEDIVTVSYTHLTLPTILLV